MVDLDPVSRTDENTGYETGAKELSVQVGDATQLDFWNFRLYVGSVIRLGKKVQLQRMYVVVEQD